MRAVRQCPGRPVAGRRGGGRHRRAAVPLRRRGRAALETAGDPDDAAAPARRVPARRGARAGGSRGAKVDSVDRRRVDGEPVAATSSSAPTGRTARRRGRSASARGSSTASRTRGTSPYGVVSRERYARRAVIELADIPGGYGWVFAKGDHVNVGVGAWQSEGPRLREHLARALRGARRSTLELENAARPPAAAAPPRHADRRRARAARRRRGGADRPGLRRRHVRVLRLVAARGRRDPRPARRPRLDARAVRGRARRGARAAASRVVEAQAGARPLAARELAGRADGAALALGRAPPARGALRAPGEQTGIARAASARARRAGAGGQLELTTSRAGAS